MVFLVFPNHMTSLQLASFWILPQVNNVAAHRINLILDQTQCVMYLFAKLKPFEQKEHFSLKEQNGLGWNLAYVRKGLTCQGD